MSDIVAPTATMAGPLDVAGTLALVQEALPDAKPVSAGPTDYLEVAPDQLIEALQVLRDQGGCDLLSSITCTDYLSYQGRARAKDGPRFEVVYHLYSTAQGGDCVVLHVPVDDGEPLPTATPVYPGANLQEREVWDLYGLVFEGHPNLRRILLWEGFEGHPMRKDWHEAYYEEDQKPFRSRHPRADFARSEDKVPWGKNTRYPADWDPDDWQEPVTYVPVSQDPRHRNGTGDHLSTESVVVNLGPHHPSTHGVFRMVVRIEGETVIALEPDMGYLHRNHEKIGERNTWLMNMPFTDRLDYINSMSNNWGYRPSGGKTHGAGGAGTGRVPAGHHGGTVPHREPLVVDRVHPERPGRPADPGPVRHRGAGDDPGPLRVGQRRTHDVQLPPLRRRAPRPAGRMGGAGPVRGP